MIEVAFPTRERPAELKVALESLYATLPPDVPVTVIQDEPPPGLGEQGIEVAERLLRPIDRQFITEKSSLTLLWNKCLLSTKSDWVLIASDDIEYQPGWYEYLMEKINSGKYLQVMMLSYSAFCVHKSLILHIGWFDQRFLGGYYEDNDWQLRISESGLKDRVCRERNEQLIKNNAIRQRKWHCINNHLWIKEKWQNRAAWSSPSFRQVGEVDHYPYETERYEARYSMKSRIPIINNTMVKNGIEVFH